MKLRNIVQYINDYVPCPLNVVGHYKNIWGGKTKNKSPFSLPKYGEFISNCLFEKVNKVHIPNQTKSNQTNQPTKKIEWS